MVKRVLKRDGRHVEFNNQKIVAAILKAMDVTEAGEDIVLAAQIAHAISTIDKDEMTVEEIQDVVENQLMNSPRQEVAKEYIRYRNKRNMARKAKTNEIFQTIIDAQVNDITRENANMNADTPAGMMMKFASEATKSYVDECLLSDPVREAVAKNYIHIHDKDYYPTKSLTCIQHPLDLILEHGLKAGHGESRPAKRIETASVLACISMETVQNEMHGGQAIPAFDFYLAPFVRMLADVTMQSMNVSLIVFEQELMDRFDDAVAMENLVDQTKDQIETAHIERMTKKACDPQGGILFTNLCIDLERCSDHAINIAEAIRDTTDEALKAIDR